MIELALAGARARRRTLVLLPAARSCRSPKSRSTPLLEREPALRDADLAIVMEPTANALHAGCLGNVNATWTFHGVSGHSARPWLADNAIERAGRGRSPRSPRPRRARATEFDGLTFLEVVSVVADPGRHRAQRHPRPRAVAERQLPLRARPLGRRTPRRGCTRCATASTASSRSTRNAPCGARRRHAPARASACVAAGDARRSRPSRRGRRSPSSPPPASPPSTSARATRAYAHRRDELGRRSPRSCAATGSLEAFAVRLNPVARRPAHLPVRAPDARPSASASAARRGGHRLRHRRAARGDAGLHPRGAGRRDRADRRPTRRPRACPSCARRSPAWVGRRFGAALDPDTEVVPTLGSKEAIFHLAQVVGGRGASRSPTPGYPVPERGALFAGREVVEAAAARRARLPARPRRAPARRELASAVAELPQQPDRRDGAARAPRARRGARARARLRPRLRRGLQRDLLRRRAAGRPRCSSPTARTSSRSTRSPSARRCPATAAGSSPATRSSIAALKRYRPERRRRAAGVRPARGRGRVARRGARRRGARGATAPSATSLLPALRGGRPAPRGRRRELLPLARAAGRRASSEAFAAAAARARRRSSRPGAFFGAVGEGYVRVALVPTLDDCRRARRELAGRRAARR